MIGSSSTMGIFNLQTNLLPRTARNGAKNEDSSSSSSSDCGDNSSHSTGYASSSSSSSSEEALSSSSDSPVPTLTWDDVRLHGILGKGSYSKVKAATLRSSTAKRTGLSTSKRKYAIKYLRNTTMERKGVFPEAAVDLAVEAELLTFLKHDNIVSLHAQGCCLSDAYVNGRRHFLLIDRLDDTLDEVLREWRLEADLPYLLLAPDKSQCPSLLERIRTVALPIARAMEYLHSENVVFRDLKPHNIGMTTDGTIKLFDFGLSRIKNANRRMTARVGSPLYMAPEVSIGHDYALPVDVYSIALILWELLTMKVPFAGMTRKELEHAVIVQNERPIVDKSCGSPPVQELISNSWIREPHLRPTFSRIRQVLENEVEFDGKVMNEKHVVPSTIKIATLAPRAA